MKSIAVSPDETYIISGSEDRTIKIWEFLTGNLLNTLAGHKAYIQTVAISPNGKYIISGSGDYPNRENAVMVWELITGKLVKIIGEHIYPIHSLAFSPNENYIIIGYGYGVETCSLDSCTYY